MLYNDNNSYYSGRDNMTDRQPQSSVPNPEVNGKARIKVIGVGGAGNNAVNRMIDAGITSAEYVAVNTDAQILACNKAKTKIQIGMQLTKGLGAGADPEIGRAAAEESKDELVKAVENTDLLFITAGMGGGTGTGAAPVIAKIAKDMKILTVAVITEPFAFEGKRRMDNMMKGIDNLRKYVDTLIIIPNEKIADVVPRNAPMAEALRVADEVLKQGIRGIADLIVTPALINLDFADVRTILKDKGLAHMGVGVAKGENRIMEAVRLAVNCPLLETTIEGATGVILNVVGGNDLTFDEVRTAANLIHGVVDYSANIIFGACIDENISDEVEVTVIATGFSAGGNSQTPSRAPAYQTQRPAPAPRPATNPNGFNGSIGGSAIPGQGGMNATSRPSVPPVAPQQDPRHMPPRDYYTSQQQPSQVPPRGQNGAPNTPYGNAQQGYGNQGFNNPPAPQGYGSPNQAYGNAQQGSYYGEQPSYADQQTKYNQGNWRDEPDQNADEVAADDDEYTPKGTAEQKLPTFVQRLLKKKQ